MFKAVTKSNYVKLILKCYTSNFILIYPYLEISLHQLYPSSASVISLNTSNLRQTYELTPPNIYCAIDFRINKGKGENLCEKI